jgi:hypothetical protein
MADYLPEKIESRCHVCQSDLRLSHRSRWDHEGIRASFIAKEVQDIDPELSRARASSGILVRHVNYENKALQQILQRASEGRGNPHQCFARDTSLLDRLCSISSLRQTWKRVSQPDAKIPFEVGLKAIELQEMLEQKQESNIVETVTRQLAAIIQAIRRSSTLLNTMKTLPDEQNISSTPLPSVNFRQELRLILRALGCDLLSNVDLTNPFHMGSVWQVKLGLWLLHRYPGPSCEELDRCG